jgi:capsular exopolysaccharide synthesis family protein
MKVGSLISFFDRESVEATEFRRLFTGLINKNDGQIKSVMITSSVVEEGKSIISSYLSMSAAETTNKKILLLDTDLRRPMINVFFKMPLEKGLSDILEKKCSIKETIKKTSIPNLSIITAGVTNSEPSILFNQDRLREVFEELKFYFDFIVVDVPPVIPVSDPLMIANEVDGVIVVIRAGKTPKDVVKRAVNLLKNASVNILGTVINNLAEVLPYHYRSKYYSYKYYNSSKKK